MERKILIGSPVRQKSAILKEFLESLSELDFTGFKADFMFVDNNDDVDSKRMLEKFKVGESQVFVKTEVPLGVYACNEETHHWSPPLIQRLTAIKNSIFKFAVDNNYTHVFMVDSDIVLHPKTLGHLLLSGEDIISEIFWTKAHPNSHDLPQVWLSGEYNFHYGSKSEVSNEQARMFASRFVHQLKIPGIYKVGGLGACTLISVAALSRGLSYEPIYNLDYYGEDRHFCIRAASLGYSLYVDTFYPAFHMYRETDLPRVSEYKEQTKKEINKPLWFRKERDNKLTLSMVVRNEADRYLPKLLEQARQYIDEAVIIDDASSDNTVEVCREILKDIPLKLITREVTSFSNEYQLRRLQWEETIKTNPDWILSLDADEIFEDKAITEIRKLINQIEIDFWCFRLYDFWNENCYREDKYWSAHLSPWGFLVRYIPQFPYTWTETPQHCGRLPNNLMNLPTGFSELRIKHMGWATSEDREHKYRRYKKLDPDALFGIREQYESILDPVPNLKQWEE